MANLPKAPLVYMFGMVRFPKVPGMDRFTPAFHDAMRSDYPLADEVTAQAISAEFGPAGVAKFEQVETKVWQFAARDKSFAFLLGDEFLGLHTASYLDHQDFSQRFERGLRGLLGVPEIGIAWVHSVGIRYIDLIVPRPRETLAQYFVPQALPLEIHIEDSLLEMRESLSVAAYKTRIGDLRVQVLRNPPTTIPLELDTPLLSRNGWKPVRPETEFAILDIDHGARFDPPEAIDPEGIRERLVELRQAASKLFFSLSTDFARDVWENRE
jgi:uncharacterized protein (TIGR04255 family)